MRGVSERRGAAAGNIIYCPRTPLTAVPGHRPDTATRTPPLPDRTCGRWRVGALSMGRSRTGFCYGCEAGLDAGGKGKGEGEVTRRPE